MNWEGDGIVEEDPPCPVDSRNIAVGLIGIALDFVHTIQQRTDESLMKRKKVNTHMRNVSTCLMLVNKPHKPHKP